METSSLKNGKTLNLHLGEQPLRGKLKKWNINSVCSYIYIYRIRGLEHRLGFPDKSREVAAAAPVAAPRTRKPLSEFNQL